MPKWLPGTTIEADFSQADAVESVLRPLFLTGGLVLSQVAKLTGLEAYTIQNWVRRGFVSPPEHKRYSKRQFCRIALINALKDCMQMDSVTRLLSYINGYLDDESDDRIDDALLYALFARLVLGTQPLAVPDSEQITCAAQKLLKDWEGPSPDSRERAVRVLRIMGLAYASSLMQQEALRLLSRLPNNEELEMHGSLV